MTKDEYLESLRQELQALPYEEQTEAMNYYRSYFEDAGEENTASVIAELGSPEQLGAYIRSNFSCVPGKSPFSPQNDGETQKKGTRTKALKDSGINILLLVLVLVLGFPIWAPIVLTVIGVAVALIGTIVGVSCALAAVAAALFIAGIVTALVCIPLFFTVPFTALLGFGTGLFLLGLALISAIFFAWLCTKILPPLIRGIVRICALPFRRTSRSR